MLLFLLFLFAVLLWSLNFILNWNIRERLPPGPTRFPLVGNLPQILAKDAKFTYKAFTELAKVHGSIMYLKIGTQDAVVVSDFDTMHDLFTKEATNIARHNPYHHKIRKLGEKEYLGIIFSAGEQWRKMRQFTIKNLREFGFGKKDSMETRILQELETFTGHLTSLKRSQDGIVRFENLFHLSLMNVLWSMVAGKSFSYKDPKLLELIKRNEELLRCGNFGSNIYMAYPLTVDVCPDLVGYTKMAGHFYSIIDFLKDLVAEYNKSSKFSSSAQPSSFIDAFSRKIQLHANGNGNTIYTEKQCLLTLTDLFNVGSETTAGTLGFIILYLIHNPDVQEKMYEEIHKNIPPGQPVRLSDQKMLPYVEAIILEILRIANVVPIPPPRTLLTDLEYKGFLLPKNTPIMCNMHAVNTDKDFWGDPDCFRPDRFLGRPDDVKPFKDRVKFVFGFGKRVCPGEQLAMASIYLYTTTLVRKFRFEKVGDSYPPLDPAVGFILGPQPYDTRIVPRRS